MITITADKIKKGIFSHSCHNGIIPAILVSDNFRSLGGDIFSFRASFFDLVFFFRFICGNGHNVRQVGCDFLRLKTSQRPVIQKNHNNRQSDNHRLAHKSTDKAKKNRQISSYNRFFRVIDIQAQSQHPEKRAQDIFTFSISRQPIPHAADEAQKERQQRRFSR